VDARDPSNPYESPLESSAGPSIAEKDARTWAMLCHLAGLAGYAVPFGHIFGPLAVWLIKKNDHPMIDDAGKEAVNFQISWTIYMAIAAALILALIGFVLLPLLAILHLVFMVIASIKTSNGEEYRYPMIIRFLQ